MDRQIPDSVRPDNVRVALCETHPALRSAFQAALYQRGLREVEICKDSTALLHILTTQMIDLVICATDVPGIDFFDLIQQVRHGLVGRNPFTVVVATAAEATLDDVRRFVNAGVDHVVRKPLSMGDLITCVNGLSVTRKQFTATESYIGPTRRIAIRSDQGDDETIEVPNTLGAKLHGDARDLSLEPLIALGIEQLQELRAHNCCIALARSVAKVASHFHRRPTHRAIDGELARLRSMSAAVERRYRGTANAPLAEVALSLSMLADLLGYLPADSGRSLTITANLLQKLGDVIRRVDHCSPTKARTVHSIVQMVRGFAHDMAGVQSGARGPARLSLSL